MSTAALRGHVKVVALLLSLGADVNFANPNGVTPVYSCLAGDHLEILELLLAAKSPDGKRLANLEAPDSSGRTPLCSALTSGRSPKCALALLKAGARYDWDRDRFGQPLHMAAERGDLDSMTFLLDQGMAVDVPGRRNNGTPLGAAVKAGKPEAVELLLKRGAKVTPQVIKSAEKGNNNRVIELLDAHAKQ
jgi:ankyrin repeat protein